MPTSQSAAVSVEIRPFEPLRVHHSLPASRNEPTVQRALCFAAGRLDTRPWKRRDESSCLVWQVTQVRLDVLYYM